MYKHDSIIYYETPQNSDIYFDDQPLETMLNSSQPLQIPSPVDIVRQWFEGLVMTKAMEGLVVKILINNYRLAIEENREAEACLILKTALSETDYPAVDKLKALIALWKLSQVSAPDESKEYYSSAKEFFNQSGNEMDENSRKYWSRLLHSESSDIVLYSLRAKAYDEFEAGRYAEAEKIYLNLIGHKFELPGTYCHLARVQLLMHDENAALKSINCAWKLRKSAVKYVLPRIIFLKILLLMLDNRNPIVWIFRLKSLVADDSVFLQWSIESTIKQYELRLSSQNYFFLLSLAEALQQNGKTQSLEEYDIWTSRIPGI